MSRRPGLSEEEKRRRLLSLFWERQEVFNLKELESLGNKVKGITLPSIKPILESLIADHLVESDKIGSGQFFWSLPSATITKKQIEIDRLNNEINNMKQQEKSLRSKIFHEQQQRKHPDGVKLLAEHERLLVELNSINNEIDQYSDCDPSRIAALESAINISRNAANRWTENIQLLLSWYKNKGIDINGDQQLKTSFEQEFNLPKDMEILE